MARRASRRDSNHAAIANVLQQVGAVVMQAADTPVMGFDLLVAYHGQLFIIEIKDGTKPPSERRLTPGEASRCFNLARQGVPYYIVTTPGEALVAIGAEEA